MNSSGLRSQPPHQTTMTNLITADYGQRRWYVSINGQPTRIFETPDFLKLEFASPGDQLVFESAHGTPRSEGVLNISLAQPLTAADAAGLQALAISKNVEIRCFPQGETPKWCSTLGMEKNDATDPVVLFHAVQHIGFHRLQRFGTLLAPTTALELAGREVKAELTGILNFTRGLKDLRVTACTKLLVENVFEVYEAVRLTNPLAAELFFDDKSGPRKGACFEVTSAGVALWGAVVDVHGVPRKYQGRLWGVNSLMRYVLNMRPMHQKGGVARSNLWFHNFGKRFRRREFANVKYVGQDKLGRDDESQRIIEMKREYRRAVLDTLRVMQQVAVQLTDA